MSLTDILGSALSGLAAAQAGLRSASNNIANVSTPGYGRERVNLSTGVTAGQVNGVRVSEPERIADRFLEANVFRRQSDFGRGEVVYSYLDRLQALLGTPGEEAGLPARLNAIGAAAVAMTGSAATEQTVRSFTSNVQDALVSMQQIERDTTVLRTDAEAEVSYTVDKINSLLRRISELNDAVSRQASLGRATGGVTDLRMTAVEELSSLLKVTVREQPDGRVFIETAGGVALVDKRLRTLSYPPSTGADQPIYPPIELRFVEEDGSIGAATGERLEGPTVGGKLGGLLELRDRLLPEFADQMSTLFTGLAETLNTVSNAGTTVPAPRTLDGRQTGLLGSDRLGFTGSAVFAVTGANGSLVARATVDFAALGPSATIDDAVAAINAGLGGAATASFSGGKLSITATASTNGVVVAQGAPTPSSRAGIGFSHFFGLNDVITGPRGTLVPMGFAASDPHGFAGGETAEFALRDPAGRTLARQTLTVAAGGSFGDIVTALNAGPLSGFGSFALDSRGRLEFTPDPAIPTASVAITSDSTNRFGTGRSLTELLQVPGASSALAASEVRPDVLASAQRLPLARLNVNAAIGQVAIGAGDNRGATAFVDQLAKSVDLGRGRVQSVERYATLVLGRAGMDAAQAEDELNDATARRDDAVNRRDNFSGVNIDEELSQLVILQNSYSASARVMSTASQMYDTLIAMVG